MRKWIHVLLLSMGLMPLLLKGEYVLNIGAGVLVTPAGTVVPPGTLVALVASTADGSFGPVDPGTLASGDDIVLATWTTDDLGGPGTTLRSIRLRRADYPGLDAGDPVALRVFPGQGANDLPDELDPYAELRVASLADGSEMPWALPSRGGTYRLHYLSPGVGGTRTDSTFLPDAPTRLRPPTEVATAVTLTEVEVTWTDHSAVEDFYSVEVSTDGVSWPISRTVPANSERFVETELVAPGRVLYFRVRALRLD